MIASKTNLLKILSGVIFATMTLWAVAGSAAANHRVVLATGEVMTVEQARVEEGRVWITWNGLSLSIAEEDVLRIESDGKTHIIDHENSTRSHPKAPASKSKVSTSGKTASQRKYKTSKPATGKPKSEPDKPNKTFEPLPLSAAAEELLTFLDTDGFGDLKWGDALESRAGLKRLYQDSQMPEVIEYVHPMDLIKLGSDDQNAIIKYAFWRNRFYMVTVWASGPEAYQSIRSAMENKFGRGVTKPGSPQTYYWIDDEADRMIEYLEDKNLGLLWMRSREVNHEYKGIRLRIPINAGRSDRIDDPVADTQTKN